MAKKGFGGMPGNMNNILKQAQKMQENMQRMQEELESKEVEASVGELLQLKLMVKRKF